MERTGHRSTDGVRVYKRSSTEQEQVVSKVLNREIRKSTLLPPSAFSSSEKENEPQNFNVYAVYSATGTGFYNVCAAVPHEY